MRTENFLDMLEQRGILSPIDIDSLREQAAAADPPLHPVFVARRLVSAGFLNPYFAKTLLTELARSAEIEPGPGASTSGDVAASGRVEGLQPQTAGRDPLLDALDALGLAPMETADLLSGTDEAVAMLPSAQQQGFSVWGRRRKALQLERPGYERYLLPACFVLAGLVVLLLVFLVIRALWG